MSTCQCNQKHEKNHHKHSKKSKFPLKFSWVITPYHIDNYLLIGFRVKIRNVSSSTFKIAKGTRITSRIGSYIFPIEIKLKPNKCYKETFGLVFPNTTPEQISGVYEAFVEFEAARLSNTIVDTLTPSQFNTSTCPPNQICMQPM